jgi:hypothetical protein
MQKMMKELLTTLAIIVTSLSAHSQSVNNYTFTAIQGSYVPLTGVPGVTETSLAANADDGVSSTITLPFTFTFAGTGYNAIQVSANGWLSFSTGSATDFNANTQANAETKKPIIFPLWDNLKCNVKPRYITTGIAPHRRFKVEWFQQSWDNGAAGDVISFQVWFFETTNVVEFLYNRGAAAVTNNSGGASIGLYDAGGKYLTLNNSGSSPVAQADVFTTNIATKPATGQIYRFSPPVATGQGANNYCFTKTSRTYSTLLSATDFPGISATADDALSGAVTLPFSFNFGGEFYTAVRASSNGWLTFASPTPTVSQNATNTRANADVIKPVLFPLWDDLLCSSAPQYNISGTAPNRIFKAQWTGVRWGATRITEIMSFQIWLYENGNVIEFIYNRENIAVPLLASASIGIYDAGGRYLTLDTQNATAVASSTVFTTNINAKPDTGQVFRFTPPARISYPGNAFIATGRVGVTQTGPTGGTYSASPPGLSFVSTSTGEVNLTASAGGTYTITYNAPGCATTSTQMTIFSLLPQPTANITVASCVDGTDGSITITNMNNDVRFVAADNDYIELPGSILNNRSAFTVEGWIKFNLADITGRTSLFGQNNLIEFGFLNATTIECYTEAAGIATATLPPSLGNGEWHHIAATGDGTQIRIYIDGISVPVTGGVRNVSNYGTSAFTTKIGSRVFNDVNGESFTGDILKVGFYNTALSASRITSLAFGPTTYSGVEAGLIAGYNFFEGTGTTVTSTPAGNNGTFRNTPEWNDPYTYVWQNSSGAVVAPQPGDNKRKRSGLSPGDYRVTVSLIGVSSPNSTTFTVGSATNVLAIPGTGASCSTTITANWTASDGAVSYSLDVATDPDFVNFVSGYNNLNVGNVTTLSVTNVPPGPVYYRVRKNSSCGVSANSNTITYQTLQAKSPVAADFSDLSCSGFTANWNSVEGAISYLLDVATDNAFTNILAAYNNLNVGNVTSYAVTGLTSGSTYYYRLRSVNAACGEMAVPSNTIPVPITIGPAIPVVGTITQASCANPFGSVLLSGLPAGEWTLRFQNGAMYAGSGTSITISDLAPGNTYNVAVMSDVCFSGNSANIAIDPLVIPTSTWTGSWSSPPTSDNYIVFASDYTSSGDVSGCTCTVNPGVKVNVSSGDTFTITNAVTTQGTLIFEDGASLVQTSNVNNVGNIIYKRQSQPMKNFDFTYWSSPVSGQVLNILSPNTLSDKYFSYNPAVPGWRQEAPSASMMVGRGYIIRTPKAGLWPNFENVSFPYSQPVEFIGVPNNGTVYGEEITPATENRHFLVGNPYPSAVDADLFLQANEDILDGTIYFWTHNTGIAPSGSKYVYDAGDYASYNITGGTGTSAPAPNPGENNSIPNGNIAAGQSFFAKANEAGFIVFTNQMRLQGNNSQFFRPATTSKSGGLEKHRIWLDLSSTEGLYKQTLLGYVQGASNDYDSKFDGITFDGNPYIDFYSINSNKKLVIQGRSLPFKDDDNVPLGFKTSVAGTFTIGISKTDGILNEQNVFLEDKVTRITHNLQTSNYSFSTSAGTFDDRFILKFTNSSLGSEDFENNPEDIIVSVKEKVITLTSPNQEMEKVLLYDITGKLLYQKDRISSKSFIIPDQGFASQVLMVKITLESGSQKTTKVIL